MRNLSVILLLIGVSKQKLLFSSTIFHLRSAECFFHGLLMNKLPVIYLVFNVMWSCSNKPSSNMFLTEVIEVHWFERWHHLCRVRPYRLHGSQ